MFARIVTIQLKPNTQKEFTQTLESKVFPLLRKQAGYKDQLLFSDANRMVGISIWDTKENMEAYAKSGYPEVVKAFEKLVEGAPTVNTFEVVKPASQAASGR